MMQKHLPELSAPNRVLKGCRWRRRTAHLYAFRALPRPRVASLPGAFVYVTLRSRQAPPPVPAGRRVSRAASPLKRTIEAAGARADARPPLPAQPATRTRPYANQFDSREFGPGSRACAEGKAESTPPSAVATEETAGDNLSGLGARAEGVLAGVWPGAVRTVGTLLRVEVVVSSVSPSRHRPQRAESGSRSPLWAPAVVSRAATPRARVALRRRPRRFARGCTTKPEIANLTCHTAWSRRPTWAHDRRYCSEEKMFGFHKPKMYRSIEGCCICRAKSSSSRFTDSKRYEKDFQSCFGLHETRSGDICNACVLLVKRWKKLPAGSKKNWNHVVDARAGPSLKTTLKPKKVKTLSGNRMKSNQISKLQKEFKRHNSDAHSTTSSASPAQSPCYSNQSDDGSDTEMASSSNRTPVFSFLDLTYWKRQKICCGIIYKGRFGEVLIDTHLFKPCCSSKKAAPEKPEEQGPAPLPISTQEW